MAPELSHVIRRVTFVLLALAAAATELAADDRQPALTGIGLASAWVGLAALLGQFVSTPSPGQTNPPRLALVVLLLLAATPFVVEPMRRQWTGQGYPVELQMVFALRNLGLGLAAFGAWRSCLRLACIVSLFLMLFAVTMTDHPAVLTLLGLYSAAGSVWLMLVHWTGLRRYFVAAEQSLAVETQPGGEPLPWLAAFLFVALVGCVLGLIAVGPQRAARVLGEWLPTSGGTGGYDPFARGGVNDGDDEAKGDNANSTGMTQSDTFLDSPLPSLYDMFNDLFGEPFKPEGVERSLALTADTKVRESEKPPADNLRPNREFPTARRSPRQPREASDRAARAIFEIEGRTPLHVRVTAFDCFDGVSWHEAPVKGNTCLLEKECDSRWMVVQERTPQAIYADEERHRIKVTRSPGTLVPTPTHLVRFRLGRIDQADFFSWCQDRILRMAQRKTPSGVAVETACRTVDPRRLVQARFTQVESGERLHYGTVPRCLHPRIATLARACADGEPPGWPQVAAVLRRLREGYTLDPTATVPEGCSDPLGHFLFVSKRGPDYQFAGAAALLLRALGYPTRLVSGFYAAPEAYDALTRHTPVVAEDLHFWAEVQLSSGDWLVLEATPGYDVLGPRFPLSERLLGMLVDGLTWAWSHAVELALAASMLALTWRRRHEMLDGLAVRLWRWFPSRTWQACLSRSVRLLEWRGARAGKPRRDDQTVSAWLGTSLPDAESGPLAAMAGWAAYGCEVTPPWHPEEVRAECRRALDTWTLRCWRTGG